jgi:hypothetical protein
MTCTIEINQFLNNNLGAQQMINRTHVLGTLLLALMLHASGAHSADTVITEGVGSTCDDALRQAKTQATERIAGSYLNSQRSLRNDSMLEESVSEYTSGVVTSFSILNTDGLQPCKVRIQAVVDIEKSKLLAPPIANNSVDLGYIGSLVDKRKDGISMAMQLINRPEHFSVDMSEMQFQNASGRTQIEFDIRKISYSGQWQADIEALLSVQKKPQIYERPGAASIGKGLLALVALPVLIPAIIIAAPFMKPEPKKEPQSPDSSLCFQDTANPDLLNCYDGSLATEVMNQLTNMAYSVVLKDPSNNLYRLAPEQRISLLQEYWSPVPLITENSSERRQRFILVGVSGLPRKEQLHIDDRLLKQGMGLSFVVGRFSLQ